MMKSVCVFCGSSTGNDEAYISAASQVGRILAKNGIKLVFGGGKVGLMGVMADAVLENEGEITGVIPEFLMHKEIAHTGVDDMIVTKGMDDRKKIMFAMSDAFIALPGGFGTMDELFEALTFLQLGRIVKPVALLNVKGYFDHLTGLIRKMVEEKFLKEKYFNMIINTSDPEELIPALKKFTPPELEKWFR